MKQSNNKNTKKLFKKLFINLARFLGYEIIDQNNFTIPTKNKKIDENLNQPGISSISIPMGKVDITRKISELTIILRTATNLKKNQNLVDQSKKRIFEFPKSEYTLRTLNSIIQSCNIALEKFVSLNINLIITDHNSKSEVLDKINKCLSKAKFKTSLINLNEKDFINDINTKDEFNKTISENMFSNLMNIYNSLLITKDQVKDLVYFVEDDYIHEKMAIEEMLYTYEKISSQLNDELFLCPADYPYLYNKVESSKIFFGSNRHWRTVNESLITFITSKKMILKYWKELKLMSTLRQQPMEKCLHKIFEKEYCLSPIPSLAMHCTNVNSVFGLPPNFKWEKIWEENKNY